jgi:hypothetical protein
MTETFRLRLAMGKRVLLSLLALALFACLFDKPKEEVELDLTNVPAGTEKIRVLAVKASDTSAIIDELLPLSDYAAGKTLQLPLKRAQGKDWHLRVEGYRNGILVYLVIIPRNPSDGPIYADVTNTWPGVLFTAVTRDSAAVHFTTTFRSVPGGKNNHWHLNLSADPDDYIISPLPNLTVPLNRIKPGSLLTIDVRDSNHVALPIQMPDTMLADEALTPAGSAVRITEAWSKGDSVFITLAYQNFLLPQVDLPKPGRGYVTALDARGLRPLAIKSIDGGLTKMGGLADALIGVDKLVIALTYANGMRIRPAVADTIDAATAQLPRVAAPAVKILFSSTKDDSLLQVVLERTNYAGLHNHVFRDEIGSLDYQLCYTDTCMVEPGIWKGAKKVYIVAHRENHSMVRPIVVDSLIPPP